MSSASVRERAVGVWRRVLSLSWPMMVQHVFRTLMRTTDVVVTGLFSPAAVAAVGLADLYAAIALQQFWALAVVAWGFARGGWTEKAAAMMDERGSVSGDDGTPAEGGAEAGD